MSNPQVTALPPMETTFEVDIEGEETKTRFKGEFTYKRPSIGIRREISITHQKLKKGQIELAKDMDILLYTIAYLHHTITAAPKWWTDSEGGINLYDTAPIYNIFINTQQFDEKWRESVWGETKDEGK